MTSHASSFVSSLGGEKVPVFNKEAAAVASELALGCARPLSTLPEFRQRAIFAVFNRRHFMTDEAAWTRFEARSEDFYEMKRRLEELTLSGPCAPWSKIGTSQNQSPGVPHSVFRCPDESDTTPESRVGSPRTPPCSLPSPDFYNLGAESSSDSSSPPSEAGSAIPGSDLAHAIDLEADSVLLGAGPTSGQLSAGDMQEQAELEAALSASLAESETIAHKDEANGWVSDSSIAPEAFSGSRSLQSLPSAMPAGQFFSLAPNLMKFQR